MKPSPSPNKPSPSPNKPFSSHKPFSSPQKPNKQIGFPLVGIQNLGETCFINVILQLLNKIDPIRAFFLASSYKEDPFYDYQLSRLIEYVFQQLNEDTKSISPFKFYEFLKEKLPFFINNQQQDAHDFLLTLLDKIYEEKNENIMKKDSKTLKNHIENTLKKDSITKKTPIKNILNINEAIKPKSSIFKENLFGTLRNTITCPDCNIKNQKFEPFLSLSLPIPSEYLSEPIPNTLEFDNFWRTYYINDETEANHRVICLNFSFLTEKKLRNLTLSGLKELVKVQIGTNNQKDLILVVCNEKIIWKMVEEESNIFEIYSQARKDNYTLCFIEIKLGKLIVSGSSLLFLAFILETDQKPGFLTLPRFFFFTKQEGILCKLDHYILSLMNKTLNTDYTVNQGFYKVKLRLYNLKDNPLNEDICENCLNPLCNCTSFKSDEYYYEKEPLYEDSNFKLFVQIAFLSEGFTFNQLTSLVLLKKSIRFDGSNVTEPSLFDCLSEFTKKEALNEDNRWFCEDCNEPKKGISQLELFSLPKYLIIQLKRFINRKKANIKVNFPINTLDLSGFLEEKGKEEVGVDNGIYELLGVVNHKGDSLEKGHYYIYIKNSGDKGWYRFDDRVVRQEGEQVICTNEAYILIYQRKN